MSFTALQSAALIAGQCTFAKMSVTFGLRLWQMLAKDKTEQAKLESNETIRRVMRAQLNEAEYVPLMVAILLFLHSHNTTTTGDEGTNLVHWGGTLAAVSQVGYFWCRVLVGYPAIPTACMATLRYGAMGMLSWELFKTAFP